MQALCHMCGPLQFGSVYSHSACTAILYRQRCCGLRNNWYLALPVSDFVSSSMHERPTCILISFVHAVFRVVVLRSDRVVPISQTSVVQQRRLEGSLFFNTMPSNPRHQLLGLLKCNFTKRFESRPILLAIILLLILSAFIKFLLKKSYMNGILELQFDSAPLAKFRNWLAHRWHRQSHCRQKVSRSQSAERKRPAKGVRCKVRAMEMLVDKLNSPLSNQ